MSTAIVLSHPAHGHINPNLPVVAELVQRGEQIIYYATDPFRVKIEKTGAQFRSYGNQELFEGNLGVGGMLGGMASLMTTTEHILPMLLDQIRAEQPDYLLVDSHAVWGNLVQQILALPAITLGGMFAISERLLNTPAMIRLLYGGASPENTLAGLIGYTQYVEISRRIDSRYGTCSPNVVNYLGNPQPLNIIFTSRYFQIGGDHLDDTYKFVGPSIATRHDASEFPFDLLGPQPLIYISMGTMYNNEADFYHLCFEALADSPYQVVLSIGDRIDESLLRRSPANFIVRRTVPQLEILQRAALFITHGGMGSANEGLWYHVPLILLPQQADHFVVANRVVELGAGLSYPRGQVTPERLQEMVNRVISEPQVKQQARKIGESLQAAGGHTRATAEIFAFKARLRGANVL